MSNLVQSEVIDVDFTSDVPIAKADSSQQIAENAYGEYAITPRYDFSTLLSYSELNIWHRTCIDIKKAVTVGLGWDLVTDDESKEPDDDYKRINAFFMDEGFPDYGFQEVMDRFYFDHLNIGNSYLERALSRSSEYLGEFYHAPGYTIRRTLPKKVNQYAKYGGYRQIRGNATKDFRYPGEGDPDHNEMYHYMTYDPLSTYYGVPYWVAAIGEIALDRSAVEFNINMFQNEMTGKIIMTVTGGEFGEQTRKNIRKFASNNLKGIKNAGRTLLLEIQQEGAKVDITHLWQEIAKNKDLSFHDGRTDARDGILTMHKVPPRLAGVMSAAQLGGTGEVEGQMQVFKEIHIEPDQMRLEYWLNHKVFRPLFEGTKWRLEFKRMDIDDWARNASAWSGLVSTGIGDIQQAQEALDIAVQKSRGSIKQAGDTLTLQGTEGLYHLLKSINKYLDE